mgnify:CR=1 FL=1
MLLWIISSYGQILILPILSSSSGSGPIISICDSETVTFTSTGDVGVTPLNFEFNNDNGELSKMISYQRNHTDESIDSALNNLGLKKNFWNRFKYSRTTKINSIITNTTEENKKFVRELISYASFSIFI